MFAAAQPPPKLSLLSLTPKEDTCSWVWFSSLWEGEKGQEHAAVVTGVGKRKSRPLSLSLSPYIYTPS